MMPLTDPRLKNNVLKAAAAVFAEVTARDEFKDYDPAKCCLLWAGSILTVAQLFPELKNLQLQGGSASWRIVPKDQDDGLSPTHYSYVYTPPDDPEEMGEVHFWCAVHPKHDRLERRGLIVDPTTVHVPELARSIGVHAKCWPPNCVWAAPDDLPENVEEYAPSLRPTFLGMQYIRTIFGRV